MSVLKYITGLFAVFLVTLFPVIIRCGDICEESADRVEAYVSSFVDEMAEKRKISRTIFERLTSSLAREPDIYDLQVTVGIRYLVPFGGSYRVNMGYEQIISLLERDETVFLEEGDTVEVNVGVSSPSQFSRIAGRYGSKKERDARRVRMGCRIGQRKTN